uniref:Uncharacterized protein n=1 Tax=Anopheles maculatus TaxID=74869 RepID=A0A182SLG2_9DIPT
MKMELAEGGKELEKLLAELEAVKQQASEKIHACRQMTADKSAIQQRNAKLVQQMQQEMYQLEVNFEEHKVQLEHVFVEKSDEYKRKIEELDQMIGDLMKKNAEQEKCAAEIEAEVSTIADKLEAVNNENIKLENELSTLQSSVHVVGDVSKNKPMTPFGGRARAKAFLKSVGARAASSSDNEFDLWAKTEMNPGSEKCESVLTFACRLRSPTPDGISGIVRNSMPARRSRKIISQRPPEGCMITRPLICRSGNSSFVSSVRLCSIN